MTRKAKLAVVAIVIGTGAAGSTGCTRDDRLQPQHSATKESFQVPSLGVPPMETVILQFRQRGSTPSLEDVQRRFNLKPGEVDQQYGVVVLDAAESLYTVLISASAQKQVGNALSKSPKDSAEGIFANPRIEPFGPPEK